MSAPDPRCQPESYHPDRNMPGCMMPDGGECCAGHALAVEDWHRLRRAVTHLAAECHRAKWQFDLSDEYRPTAKVARDLVAKAFAELQRIGDVALKLRDGSSVSRPNQGDAA